MPNLEWADTWEHIRSSFADIDWGTAPNWTVAVFAALAAWGTFRILRHERRQLTELQTQLAEQRMFFEHQSAVLELQRSELHASARDRRRVQARLVEVSSRAEEALEAEPEGLDGPRRAASVTNSSHEPIHRVVVRFAPGDVPAEAVQAYGSARWSEPPLALLRPRRGANFFSAALPEDAPAPVTVVVRFTDHNAVHWELDEDGQLTELDDRQAW